LVNSLLLTLIAAILVLFVGSMLAFPATGGKIQVGILFDGGATKPSPNWSQVPTFQMALEEINSAGVAVEFHIRNTRDVGANVAQYTQELIDLGVVYINGSQTSANSVVSAPIAVDAGVVYGGVTPSTDVLSGCTEDVVHKGFLPSKMPSAGKGFAPRYGVKMMGNNAKLELGKHRISQEIAELNLSKTSLSGQHAEGMMSKLYSPDQYWDINTLVGISD
jgi:hypothetical protein